MTNSLTPFFNPKGVVVIGASTSPEKLGYGVARNLIQSGYRGAIHFVSQKSGTLFDRPLYTNLDDVPDPVDLAILIVPTQVTPQTIEDCAKRGIKAAIIVSSGFREVGAEGAALEQQCVDIARKHGVRLLGPNCIGTLDTHLPLDTTFLQPPMPLQGGIGFISHSGAFAAAIIDWAREQGFGFSQIVSLGNQADVNETDVLPEVAKDEHTRVIVLYMESVSDGQKFVQAASEVTKHKPVIALKVGRFEAGQKAAASHTGALAGSEAAFDAAFAKAGVLRADTAEQMFDWARALENCPLPRGKRMAILTNAGGPGVIAADSLETNGLLLSQLTEATLEALSSYLPSSASVHNPVDMLASASPDAYATCLKLLLQDENVDGVLVILPPPPMFKTEDVAEKIIQTLESYTLESASLLSEKPEASFRTPESKPVVIALMGSNLVEEARKKFQHSNVPTYPFPERAASALGALAKQKEFLDRRPQAWDKNERLSVPLSLSTDDLGSQPYGITTTPIKLARNENEAVIIATELGFPVVMKIASPDILHKSDIGGVLLNINSEEEAQSGYTLLLERARKSMPNARIEGVHVQKQIPEGQEVIIGAVRDPLFGALMMFGSGGIEVEGLKDVAFALAPLNQAEAREMIRKTWAGRKLKGFRSIPPVDEESVIDVLIKLSLLAYEHPEVEEIEINPLRVLQKGAVAVDVRMKIKGE
ncbi:acetate--CoA ligase family protein [Candidatus Villigracilis saccharophilus]|uniref:acetate--CoA ligase family protein n=1 Tax=Candidatus Villigracilis saccharophilus TaxID=3140684 RepID=UPI003136703E|nr:acetate--CoA ligase family protein [Anaerolineales bacterium]